VTAWKGQRRAIGAAIGALLVAIAVIAGVIAKSGPEPLPERAPGERPQLLLLTSLPIVFPEELTLDAERTAALTALQSRYEVAPISVADTPSLRGHQLLLIAQPQAQPAEYLVQLDRWVRSGGHVLLLADPALEWPSDRPLGDVTRPPRAFADTGLLLHWGVRLDAPDQRGSASADTADGTVETASPGTVVAVQDNCTVGEGGLIAHCRVGEGAATIVADADFIHVDSADSGNLQLLLRELDQLER
jgi:hypothetical protein